MQHDVPHTRAGGGSPDETGPHRDADRPTRTKGAR